MKIHTFFITLLCLGWAGTSSLWGQRKEPLYNLEHFDEKNVQWGYYFGINMFDFKFDYKDLNYSSNFNKEVGIEKNWGFNVGLSGDLRLIKYVNLRFEPGLVYNQKDLTFPGIEGKRNFLRQIKSTYIYIPLLLKFSSERWYNFKPYATIGASATINLSSNQGLSVDNSERRFRVKKHILFYELGLGLDIYTPYFRMSPSIRGLFSLQNELIPDRDPNSNWTGNLNSIKSRGFLINLTFE